MEPLQVAALLWAIGDQATDELPGLATAALVRGLDSPSLRELAGLPPGDFWGIKRLFESVLDELGLELPDEQTALWQLARRTAAEIVEGTLSPSTGAHWIWSEVHHRIVREGDLRVFIGHATEWDDHPKHRTEIEASIVEAAKRLLAQPELRRWLRIQARQRMSPIADSGTRADVAPSDLPISEALTRSFHQWAEDYDATFEPGSRGFESVADAARFVNEGRDLVVRLQDELGESWRVEYHPEPTKSPGLRLQRR